MDVVVSSGDGIALELGELSRLTPAADNTLEEEEEDVRVSHRSRLY